MKIMQEILSKEAVVYLLYHYLGNTLCTKATTHHFNKTHNLYGCSKYIF